MTLRYIRNVKTSCESIVNQPGGSIFYAEPSLQQKSIFCGVSSDGQRDHERQQDRKNRKNGSTHVAKSRIKELAARVSGSWRESRTGPTDRLRTALGFCYTEGGVLESRDGLASSNPCNILMFSR